MAIGAAWGEIWNESVWAAIWSQTPVVAPTVTTQPTSQSVTAGNNATFTAAFSNATSVQWYDASDDSALSGETSATLTVAAVIGDNGNTYYCIATNDSLTVQTNTVTLTVTEAGAKVLQQTPLNVVVQRFATTKVKEFTVYINNVRNLSFDFSTVSSDIGSSISSIAFAIDSGSGVTLGESVLEGAIAQTEFTAGSVSDAALIVCSATFDSGVELTSYATLTVIDLPDL